MTARVTVPVTASDSIVHSSVTAAATSEHLLDDCVKSDLRSMEVSCVR